MEHKKDCFQKPIEVECDNKEARKYGRAPRDNDHADERCPGDYAGDCFKESVCLCEIIGFFSRYRIHGVYHSEKFRPIVRAAFAYNTDKLLYTPSRIIPPYSEGLINGSRNLVRGLPRSFILIFEKNDFISVVQFSVCHSKS